MVLVKGRWADGLAALGPYECVVVGTGYTVLTAESGHCVCVDVDVGVWLCS